MDTPDAPLTPAGVPGGRDLPSATPPRDSRPRHYYPIDRGLVYSLQDAARAAELPEGKLRRAILLDELAACEVDDDRHYLIDGAALQTYLRRLHRAENCAFPENDNLWLELAYCLVIPLLILLILIFAKTPEGPRSDSPAPKPPGAERAMDDASTPPGVAPWDPGVRPSDANGFPNY